VVAEVGEALRLGQMTIYLYSLPTAGRTPWAAT
jgi:hypothetical protein